MSRLTEVNQDHPCDHGFRTALTVSPPEDRISQSYVVTLTFFDPSFFGMLYDAQSPSLHLEQPCVSAFTTICCKERATGVQEALREGR